MTDDIPNWFRRAGLIPYSSSATHTRLYFNHSLAKFAVDILENGQFLSLGADLMRDIEGTNKSEFYRYVHEYNSRLNGPKVAIQKERFILVQELWREQTNQDSLIRDVYWFVKVHELAMRTLGTEATRLKLKFKT